MQRCIRMDDALPRAVREQCIHALDGDAAAGRFGDASVAAGPEMDVNPPSATMP